LRCIKRDLGGDKYDLGNKIIKNCKTYVKGIFNNNDLVSKAFVDDETSNLLINSVWVRVYNDNSEAYRKVREFERA